MVDKGQFYGILMVRSLLFSEPFLCDYRAVSDNPASMRRVDYLKGYV